ncbi:MAG: hypothetical protein LBL47_03360 [Lactobacillus sp.]|jgi:hypothetical protein|nr:hypothetical protein [Lactobacillus sp.]
MAGVAAATSAGVKGYSQVKNIVENQRLKKNEIGEVKQNQYIDIKKQKNLLDSQLATRRARLGAMGIASSGGSNAAVQNKTINDAYEGIGNRQTADAKKISSIRKKRNDEAEDMYIESAQKILSSGAQII